MSEFKSAMFFCDLWDVPTTSHWHFVAVPGKQRRPRPAGLDWSQLWRLRGGETCWSNGKKCRQNRDRMDRYHGNMGISRTIAFGNSGFRWKILEHSGTWLNMDMGQLYWLLCNWTIIPNWWFAKFDMYRYVKLPLGWMARLETLDRSTGKHGFPHENLLKPWLSSAFTGSPTWIRKVFHGFPMFDGFLLEGVLD